MKNSSQISARKTSFVRLTFVFLAMVAALILVTLLPSKAQTNRTNNEALEALPGDDKPVSMQSQVQVMVELQDAPAAVPYAAALQQAQAQADAARAYALAHPKARSSQAILSQPKLATVSASVARQIQGTVQQLDQAQRALVPALTAPDIGGKILFRTQRAYNGISMYVSADNISKIAALPNVKAVHVVHPKYATAFTDIEFLGTRAFWGAPFGGAHGETIKVGIIDSGLDYVHKNFGGSGNYTGVGDAAGATGGQFPTAKVPGGYDFAGDAYDGTNSPVPDSNPFDGDPALGSIGHGTSCASLIGGYGLDGSGATYTGSYSGPGPSPAPDISSFKISPGFAPKCLLYPLRVFGNTGSTGLVSQALEWAMDPNGDGNFSDHLDVVSMSLGSNEGYPDDESAVAAANAASIGIIVCSASGNAGDTYYITSSPAVASGTLSVAATFNDQGGYIYNALLTPNTNAGPGTPPDGKYKGIYGTASPHTAGLTADVAYGVPNNASTAFTNPANLAGKFVLVDRGATSFTDMVTKANAAGAAGVIINNFNHPGEDPITPSTTGQPAIPDLMISRTDRDTIVAAAGGFDPVSGLPTNSPVNVTLANGNGAVVHPTTATDTMPAYSARGPRLGDTALKPDISAPAEVVGVADNHTGDKVAGFNGTSSATPHVAGAMALMRQEHPSWTVEELLALAINTATHELTTGPSPVPLASPAPSPGNTYGVSRVGAGRIDLAKAAQANVVAFNQTNPGLVSVSFGAVEVPVDSSTTLTKAIKIKNNSVSSVTYNVTYQDITPATGANFTVPGAPITVAAGASGSFNVSFSATGNLLKHERDQSITDTQSTGSSAPTNSRQWLTEKAGYAVLTPTSGPEPVIRVPLYAAPKPVSSMHSTITSFVPDAASGTLNVSLSGGGINTGASYPTDIVSLGKAFELQYQSPLVGSSSASNDPNVIKYVGITSDWANRSVAQQNSGVPIVTFALEGFGNQTVPEFNSSDKEIEIDFDFDNVPDAVVYLSSRTNSQTNAHSNAYRPIYVDVAGFFGPPGAAYGLIGPTNAIQPSSRDTNSFNNSVTIVPVAGVGLVSTGFSAFQYRVVTFDRNGNSVDETPFLFYDAAAPGVDANAPLGNPAGLEPFLVNDLPATTLALSYNGANLLNNNSIGALVVHMHNGTGYRSDTIPFKKPTAKSFTPTSGKVGSFVTITGTNFNSGTVVKFFNNKVATINVISSTTISAQVPVGAITGPIKVSNSVGSSTAPGTFTVIP